MGNLWTKILLFVFVACLIAFGWYFDALSYLTLDQIRHYEEVMGWWFPLIFLLAFVIGELLQVPSVLWIFFAGMIWPLWFALLMSILGAVLAGTCAFLVARYFLGRKFTAHLPPSVAKLDAELQRRPVVAVLMIRLTTFLHPAMHWALAASSVKLPAFMFGTAIGILPLTVAIVLLGEVFLAWWEDYSPFVIGGGILLIVVYVVFLRTRRQPEESSR